MFVSVYTVNHSPPLRGVRLPWKIAFFSYICVMAKKTVFGRKLDYDPEFRLSLAELGIEHLKETEVGDEAFVTPK